MHASGIRRRFNRRNGTGVARASRIARWVKIAPACEIGTETIGHGIINGMDIGADIDLR